MARSRWSASSVAWSTAFHLEGLRVLKAWRIAKTRYANAAFDGEGARLYGGRWSSAGIRVAYASQSVALATLEVLVGLEKISLLPSYSLVSVQFDESDMEVLALSSLPANWRTYPAPPELQMLGDRWIADNRSLVLQVPSAIIETEANYLLNPMHSSFASLTISDALPFEFDPRLVAQLRNRSCLTPRLVIEIPSHWLQVVPAVSLFSCAR